MKQFFRLLLTAAIIVTAWQSAAQASWTFEVLGGSAYNFTTPLTIRQTGENDIKLDARYSTRPFNGSPYYSMRLGHWTDNRGWEFEMTHHKLYLENLPAEVQHFEISHGYNQITLNRAWDYRGFIFHFGLGLVMTHPETTVRGKSNTWVNGLFTSGDKGFRLSGTTAQAAISKRFFIFRGLFINIEGKLTGSYATIPVVDGDATVPNVALHGLFGLGYEY